MTETRLIWGNIFCPVRGIRTLAFQYILYFVPKHAVYVFITDNTRISFHKAHLYKSIRFIFTCEESLYSQSEFRTAISHVEV